MTLVGKDAKGVKKILEEALGTTEKAKLKSLFLHDYYLFSWTEEPVESSLPPSLFQGFDNLRKLSFVSMDNALDSISENHLLLPLLADAEFPHLDTLEWGFGVSGTHEGLAQLLKMVLHGSLRQVKSLVFPRRDLTDEALDVLVQIMPRLRLLDFSCNYPFIGGRGELSINHKARLQNVATRDCPGLELRI